MGTENKYYRIVKLSEIDPDSDKLKKAFVFQGTLEEVSLPAPPSEEEIERKAHWIPKTEDCKHDTFDEDAAFETGYIKGFKACAKWIVEKQNAK